MDAARRVSCGPSRTATRAAISSASAAIGSFALAERQWTDRAVDRLTMLAAAHRTWLEGDLGDPLDEQTVRELERRIPIEALAARTGLRPRLTVGSADVQLVRQEDASERLTAPGPSSNLWPRMASAIAEKAARMADSGAEWLRLIPYNHFFLLTHWPQLPLGEKLNKLADEVRSSLSGCQGRLRIDPLAMVALSASGRGSSARSARCKPFCGPRRSRRGVLVSPFRQSGGRVAVRGRGP